MSPIPTEEPDYDEVHDMMQSKGWTVTRPLVVGRLLSGESSFFAIVSFDHHIHVSGQITVRSTTPRPRP